MSRRWQCRFLGAVLINAVCLFLITGCWATDQALIASETKELQTDLYVNPQPVEIAGYTGSAMEPFISLDGSFLFFNTDDDPKTHSKTMRYARRNGAASFVYLGELQGANLHQDNMMEAAAPSLDRQGHFYFTSTREYDNDSRSVFVGDFNGKTLAQVHAVEGDLTPQGKPGLINMDVSISPDGDTLYISRTHFNPLLALLFHPSPDDSSLLIAHRQGNVFIVDPRSAELLKRINTPALQYAPAISADGLELYFTRADTVKGLRIMVADRSDPASPFNAPCVLSTLTGFVEAPSISLDKREMFFHKKIDDTFVIYRAERNPAVPRVGLSCH